MSRVPFVTATEPANAVFVASVAVPPGIANDTVALDTCAGSVSVPFLVNTVTDGFHFVPLASIRSPPSATVFAPVAAPAPAPMVTSPTAVAAVLKVTPPAPVIATAPNTDEPGLAKLIACATPPVNSVVCPAVAMKENVEPPLVCVKLPPTRNVPAVRLPTSGPPLNVALPPTTRRPAAFCIFKMALLLSAVWKFVATVTVAAPTLNVPLVTVTDPANMVLAARFAAPPLLNDTFWLWICAGNVTVPLFVNTVVVGFHLVPLASLRSPPSVTVTAPVAAPDPAPMITLPSAAAAVVKLSPPPPFIERLPKFENAGLAKLTACDAPLVNSVVCPDAAA